jgi:ubiquitin carboxyl-terminal hydrolase 25/28
MFYFYMMQNYPDKTLENKAEEDNTLYVHLEHKPQDIYSALDFLFGLESVDQADGSKVDRYPTIEHPPPMLQIFLQRHYFDKKEKTSSKIKHHVQLEDTIYMDRYMTPSPELEVLRTQSRDLTRKLTQLERQRQKLSTTQSGLTAPVGLDRTWQFINSLGDELDDVMVLQENLQQIAEKSRKDLERVNEEIKSLESQRSAIPFDQFDTAENCYRLFAVFVHSGTTSGGHYWVYLRDFRNNLWRNYNDEHVNEVKDTKEIFDQWEPAKTDNPNSHRAPYFVVYVRDSEKYQTEPFFRVKPIVEEADTEMADVEDIDSRESSDDWQDVPLLSQT